MASAELARAHVRVAGRVQGVGFRYWTANEARRRALTGWVRNLDSGGVEAVFEGSAPAVNDMLAWVQEGPSGAFVRQVQTSWTEPPEHFASFEIRATADG